MPSTYDAIIIGTGQAGPSLANRLCEAGQNVAIIERGRFGGTCVNNGCMPTKTMVASAYAAHLAMRASDYGVIFDGQVRVDMKKVKARKDAISSGASRNIETWLGSMRGCTVIRGHAKFLSPSEVEVGGERLSAPKIFINVGGRPSVPSTPGIGDIGLLTNESIMDLDIVPEHLLVLGGSYIGLEFAQIFRRFGSAVTIIEAASRLIPREDEDISNAVMDILVSEGIDVRLGAACTGLAKQGTDVRAWIETANRRAEQIECSHVLAATGRKPNTGNLGLDAAGVQVEARGFIVTDEYLQTSVKSIWALGDCNGRGAFTHTAFNDFEIAAANILDKELRSVNDRILTYGLFIDPPLGRVGMTEREARATGRPLLYATRPMSRVGRAVEKGETLGFMKVIVDARTQRIMGAAILGTSGDEAIHCITAMMYADAPSTTLKRAVQIHPTVSELIPTLLGSLTPIPAS